MNISICCPSYKRPKVETLDYIPFCKVYVDHAEFEEYKRSNKDGANIVACPNGVQGNLCRVRNYILHTEFESGADAVCIVDDDMRGLYIWRGNKDLHNIRRRKLEAGELLLFLEKYSNICREWGFYFWGANCNCDAMSYRPTYIPFHTNTYIGGPFQVFLKGNECYYDETLPLKEDFDMTLQQCSKYRGCLRLNFLCYEVKQSEQAGGCATYRNMIKEKEQFELLQRKWGSKIVREDKSNKGHTKKQKQFDYNPKIVIPIKGV